MRGLGEFKRFEFCYNRVNGGLPDLFTRSILLGMVLFMFWFDFSSAQVRDEDGPLGEWPDFTPLGYITAPHPNYPETQTHLYGDWGGIVGEEFIFLQDGLIKLIYHSYHESYMTHHPHTEELLADWALGYDKVTKVKFTPLALPGGPYPGSAWQHTDTPAYIQHPISGEHLLYNTVRPGTTYLHPEWAGLPGHESSIQVATSADPPAIGMPFTQNYEDILVADLWWEEGWNNNGVIKGGLSEPTPVWVPHLGKIRLFYRGLHGSPGSYWNWRISYADSDDGKSGWVKNPVPSFDPSDPSNPAYRWTLPYPEGFSFRGSWQAHCTGDSIAGGVHMILCVSNQNYAGFGHLAYYWSPDWGDTWLGHPDNPIIVPGEHPLGVPDTGFQRTPTLMVDDEYHRYVIAYNSGHDADEPARRHTHLAVASRPGVSTEASELPVEGSFRLIGLDVPLGDAAAQFSFELPERGHLRLELFSVDGRKIAEIEDAHFEKGQVSLSWNKTDDKGRSLSSGLYLFRVRLVTRNGRPQTASGRVILLR